MSNVFDDAQHRELLDRELAIKAQLQRVAESHAPRRPGLEGVCMDCELPIEPARLAALNGKTCRCARCAQRWEHQMKGYRR